MYRFGGKNDEVEGILRPLLLQTLQRARIEVVRKRNISFCLSFLLHKKTGKCFLHRKAGLLNKAILRFHVREKTARTSSISDSF